MEIVEKKLPETHCQTIGAVLQLVNYGLAKMGYYKGQAEMKAGKRPEWAVDGG